MAVGNGGATVSILLGNGDGTFTAAPTANVGNVPDSIAIADYNADGIPDLAVANFSDGTISILLGNGDGTFTLAETTPNLGCCPTYVAAGDFNQDGRLDLVVTLWAGGSSSAVVLPGGGEGHFLTPGLTLTLPPRAHPVVAAVANFNGEVCWTWRSQFSLNPRYIFSWAGVTASSRSPQASALPTATSMPSPPWLRISMGTANRTSPFQINSPAR